MSSLKILVLEAGPDDRDNLDIKVPINAASTAHSDIDWSYYTIKQKHSLQAFNDQVFIYDSNRLSKYKYVLNMYVMIYTSRLKWDMIICSDSNSP